MNLRFVLTMFVLFAMIAPIVSAQSLLLYCKFDDSLTCEDGETPMESAGISFNTGFDGGAVEISDDDILSYPYTNNLNIIQGTISMWFKAPDTLWDGNDHIFFHHQSSSNNANLRFRFLGVSQNGACTNCYESYMFTGVDQGASIEFSEGDYPSVNGWYFLTTTWDSSTIKIYLNGELVDTWTGSMSIGSPSDRFYIGSYSPYGPDYVANGLIDELKIYDYIKTDEEIMNDYLDYMNPSEDKYYTKEEIDEMIDDLQDQINTQKSMIEQLIDSFNEFIDKVMNYFSYLPYWSRKSIVCNAMKKEGLTQKTDLGLSCELKTWKKREICKCKKA